MASPSDNPLKRLILEIHRRSLWQVLGIYLVASWAVLSVVDTLGGALNLPDWFPSVALALLLVGLPIVLATAFVQEGGPGREARDVEVAAPPSRASGLFTWRNAFGGGVLAFALWGVVAAGWALLGAGPSSVADTEERPAIAVLPFENRSGDEGDQSFTDGIHDELRTALSRVSGLRVISRTSVREYRNTSRTAPDIGRELGVGYLLEGGVQRAGDQVRINLSLIDTSDGSQVWANPYQRVLTTEGLFEIQSEVARSVAAELGAAISDEEVRRIARASTNDLQAYESYMRAYSLTNDYVEAPRGDLEEGLRLYQEAIARDPSFAMAYAGMAGIHGWFVLRRFDYSQERWDAAHAAAVRALELSPDLPEAHYAMAAVLYRVDRDYAAALDELRRAEVGLRGDGAAALLRAYIVRRRGDMAEGIGFLEEAMALDPRSDVPLLQLTVSYQRARDYQTALDYARRSVAVNPQRQGNHRRVAQIESALSGSYGPLRA